MSSALDKLGSIDKLLGLTPFFRCPNCGKRDEDGAGSPTFFILKVQASMPITIDEAAHVFRADKKDLEIETSGLVSVFRDEVTLTCNDCQFDFALPPDWTVSY